MIKIIQSDITPLPVDAIVNAANERDFLSRSAAHGNGEREMEVVFCCFSERDAAVYRRLLAS